MRRPTNYAAITSDGLDIQMRHINIYIYMYINMYNLLIFLAFLARIHAKALREILKVSVLVANVPGKKSMWVRKYFGFYFTSLQIALVTAFILTSNVIC